MRKFVSLMLCIILVITMSVPAFAEESAQSNNVTVTDTPVTVTDTPEPSGGNPETPTNHTHSWDAGTVTTPATCIAEGVKTYRCSCGATQTEAIAATGVHTYGPWIGTDSGHTRTCTGCSTATESGSHTWDAGGVSQQPTCSTEGTYLYTCTVCNHTKTEAIPTVATAHTYGNWVAGDKNHSRTCSGCGNQEIEDHNLAVSVTIPATCLEEGVTIYGCVVCGGIFQGEVLPKLTTHTYDNACDPDCNICGATRDASHKFSTVWSKNAKGHWHACTVCGEQADFGSHYPGPAATEEKAQICLTCGYTLTAKLNHTHKYSTEWTSDETGHWYACDGCDEQKDFEEHSYDDPCDPDCNVCGYHTNTAHSYDGTWLSDESGHWGVCTLCGEEGEVQEHDPGPEATETEAQVCTVCGFEIAPAQEHVHEFEETWVTDDENHWKECECGEKADEAPHTWDEGTENEDDTITYVCTECQAERTEEAPETSGSFPWWIVLVVLLLIIVGAVVALILLLRKNKAPGKFTK